MGLDEIDIAAQTCTSHHVWTDGAHQRRMPIPFRYAWPSELDLKRYARNLNHLMLPELKEWGALDDR